MVRVAYEKRGDFVNITRNIFSGCLFIYRYATLSVLINSSLEVNNGLSCYSVYGRLYENKKAYGG